MFFLEINTTLLHFCYKPFLNPVCTESNDFGNLFNRNSLFAHSNRRILSLAFTPSRIALISQVFHRLTHFSHSSISLHLTAARAFPLFVQVNSVRSQSPSSIFSMS